MPLIARSKTTSRLLALALPVLLGMTVTVFSHVPAAVAQTAAPQATAPSGSITPAQKAEIEAIIKNYLLANPEVMIEVQSALEAKMEKIQAEKMQKALAENAAEIFRSPSAPVAGNPKGDVTIVEFFDYNCGYCKKALTDLASVIQKDKNVRVVLKELPILSKGSEEASRVALAAKLQGKYWEFHRALMEAPGQANEAAALRVAEKIGLDMPRLKKDMVGAEVKKEIADTRALAQKMGIQGTPHFLVGDRVVPGAPEGLANILASQVEEIRKAGGCKICGG
ncbi:MAG TPA: DsbA family protein [Hyphomicrobiaceae bacterium]|mgnify:CR=1 FL=1|nr:DsbA family protein [Hyphomicrobiaceae bacterium]